MMTDKTIKTTTDIALRAPGNSPETPDATSKEVLEGVLESRSAAALIAEGWSVILPGEEKPAYKDLLLFLRNASRDFRGTHLAIIDDHKGQHWFKGLDVTKLPQDEVVPPESGLHNVGNSEFNVQRAMADRIKKLALTLLQPPAEAEAEVVGGTVFQFIGPDDGDTDKGSWRILKHT